MQQSKSPSQVTPLTSSVPPPDPIPATSVKIPDELPDTLWSSDQLPDAVAFASGALAFFRAFFRGL